jgi:hypothetical protein
MRWPRFAGGEIAVAGRSLVDDSAEDRGRRGGGRGQAGISRQRRASKRDRTERFAFPHFLFTGHSFLFEKLPTRHRDSGPYTFQLAIDPRFVSLFGKPYVI